MTDNVNSPAHYQLPGGGQVIDRIREVLTEEQFRGYLKGNILKYLYRAGHKNDEQEDLEKAQWYLSALVEDDEEEVYTLTPKCRAIVTLNSRGAGIDINSIRFNERIVMYDRYDLPFAELTDEGYWVYYDEPYKVHEMSSEAFALWLSKGEVYVANEGSDD